MSHALRIFQDTAPHVRPLIEMPHHPLMTRSSDSLCLLGSCFTWHLHNEALRGLGLNSIFQWHTGFHFSTESLANLLERIADGTPHGEEDLYWYPDEVGGFRPFRYYFNQRFPAEQKDDVLARLAVLDGECAAAIRSCSHLMLVTGTPRVVRLRKTGECVAVTARMPADDYVHHRNSVEEEIRNLERYKAAVLRIRGGRPVTMLYMLSPMRYMFHALCSEGCSEDRTDQASPFIEDSLGKAIMRVALHSFLERQTGGTDHYFPAFELVIDELRAHESFCGDHAHVPHFPHVSHYVVRRFAETHASRGLQEQMELSEELARMAETARGLLMPAQKAALLKEFVATRLPRLCELAGADEDGRLNSSLFRSAFLLLGACAKAEPDEAAAALRALCDAMPGEVRIAIWGAGGNYAEMFSEGVRLLADKAAHCVLTDGSPAAWGRELDGLTVVAPETLAAMDVDYIFIASAFHDDIHARIRQLGLSARVA